MLQVPLSWFLIVAAALFSIGLYGIFARRNAVAVLMSIELMLNAVNINLVAFWRYQAPDQLTGGLAFAVFVFIVAAAEAAVGLALILSIYRRRKHIVVEDMDLLKW